MSLPIITQGNVRTSDGQLHYLLSRQKPMGFALTEERVGKADRFVIRGTDFSDSEQFTICELYAGEELVPIHSEKIQGY